MSTRMGPCGQGLPQGQCQSQPQVGGAVQILRPSTNNNVITCVFQPSLGPACIISFHPHYFLLQGYYSYSHSCS